jgi:ubiquinone/menaquinone biosynthesis C-methylase UbiE
MAPDYRNFLEILAPTAGERILDVGAGKGAVAGRVLEASKGAEVYAIEPNENRVKAMKRDFSLVKSSVAGAESLPFPDSHFDKVYSTMALHHFSDLDKALGEIARVLRPGGSFVVLEVEPHSLVGRFFRFFGTVMGEHMTMMSEDQLKARLTLEGKFRISRSAREGSSYLIQATRA